MKKETPEAVFLRFALPCAFIIQLRGDIDEKMVDKLEEAAIKKIPVERETLEKIFYKAIDRIKIIAEKDHTDIWDTYTIRKYFLKEHNTFIDEGYDTYKNAPESLKKLCRIDQAEIIKILEDTLIVKLENKSTRIVHKTFIENPKLSEKVWIHYGYAVERVRD